MMTGANSSSNNLLAIAGLLAAVAAGLYFVTPPQTVAAIAQRVGLQDRLVGPVPEATAAGKDSDARPAAATSKATNASESSIALSSFFHARKSLAAPVGDPKAESKTPDNVHTEAETRPAIKATTREGGHLIERYLFRNGGIVVMVDGRVFLVS